MLTFPPVYPDTIKSLDVPDYKVSSSSWKSGDKFFKRTQFTGSQTKLNLEFKMIPQSELNQINLLWDNCENYLLFKLPLDFFFRYPITLRNSLNNLKSISFWCIESAPSPTPKILCGNSVTRINRYDLNLTITSQIA